MLYVLAYPFNADDIRRELLSFVENDSNEEQNDEDDIVIPTGTTVDEEFDEEIDEDYEPPRKKAIKK